MPIYIQTFNLVINKTAVAEKYVGGIEQFRQDYNIATGNINEEDEHLFSLGRMNIDDFDIDALIENGLHYDDVNLRSDDFTIAQRYGGLTWEVNWLQSNDAFVWHNNTNINAIGKAQKIGNATMNEIEAMFDNGEKPFESFN